MIRVLTLFIVVVLGLVATAAFVLSAYYLVAGDRIALSLQAVSLVSGVSSYVVSLFLGE